MPAKTESPPILLFKRVSTFELVLRIGEGTIDEPGDLGSIYKPTLEKDYHAIGFYVQESGSSPSGSIVTLSVQNDNQVQPLLKNPIDYSLTYVSPPRNRLSNPPTTRTHAFWAPTPPAGYVALGMVATNEKWNNELDVPPDKPLPTEVMCLRQDKAEQDSKPDQYFSRDMRGNPFKMFRIRGTQAMYSEGNSKPVSAYYPKNLRES